MSRATGSVLTALVFLIAANVSIGKRADDFSARFVNWESDDKISVSEFIFEPPDTSAANWDVIAKTLASVNYSSGQPVTVRGMLISRDQFSARTNPYVRIRSTVNAFMIVVQDSGVELVASDLTGLIYAADELSRIVDRNEGELRKGVLIDFPALDTRALHFNMQKVDFDQAKLLIDEARQYRFNTVVLGLVDAVNFNIAASNPRADAITPDELLRIVQYARSNGLEVVPHVALLTHQNEFFKNKFPQLMFNQVTYDPRKEEVYDLVFDYLDAVIDLLNPKAIHIGHDEAKGWTEASKSKWLRPGEAPLPPELFLFDVKKLHSYLQERGIEVWMWGDMLIAESEMPSMGPEDMNGRGGYEKLRTQLPKDIVICDWRYYHKGSKFPTALALKEAGHPVLGSTWKVPKNIEMFSKYMASPEMNGRGMIATTWFHVQYQEYDLVKSIIETSGKSYWNPDMSN